MYDLIDTKITPKTAGDLLAIPQAHVDAEHQCVVASQNMRALYVGLHERAFGKLHALRPLWTANAGLECLIRLAENPGRFWLRYLVEPLFVLAAIVRWNLQPRPSREGSSV